MTALTMSAVIDRASTILVDAGNERWTTAELAKWASDGQRELGIHKPDALAKTIVHPLVAGTRQPVPSDSSSQFTVMRNMGTDGLTPGAEPRLVRREDLSASVPNWHASTPSATVKHWMVDDENPKAFYVWPPQPATTPGQVEIVYSAAPVEVAVGGSFVIDDNWLPAIVNYTLYRAYAKDAENAANAGLSQGYYQAFMFQMTGKTQGQASTSPNRLTPANQ